MPVQRPSEKSIFLEACEITSAAERAAYLDQACEGSPQLRAEVEALLRAHEAPQRVLDAPEAVTPTSAQAPPEGCPGTVIGPYKLLQQIGEGGMGTVFMAEQTMPVQRKVALKVIKPGMDSRQVIARFEAERQALAMMDHVNIARVFDGGAAENGRPYFVMELVHGVPITKYCDDNHLTPRQRLELFVPVCQAIQHAHQKGIIHRDVKPSNVMVTLYDGKPVPKVIDFGVAKATEQKLTERTLFTQYGTMVGTLEYMSPEQAEMSALGVDTRSDIYSLGVLLYELLTGSTPLTHKRMKEAAYAEILRMIKEEEPPRPSTRLSDSGEALASISAQRHMEPAKLTKLVRGELDWIVMKTLEKDRNRRYETANGFAMDVQRYLADEPVHACPPSAWYRFRKFARRNKKQVLAASLVALVLVGGIIGTTWGMLRARDAEADAVNETKQKEQALGEKVGALQTAQDNYREAKKQEALAKENENTAKAEKLLAGRRFYAAQMNLAMQAWEAGQPVRVLALLESQRPKVDEDDLRTFEWYYLWRLCQGGYRLRLPKVNFDNSAALAISPDGNTVASGFAQKIKLWDTLTGREKATLTGHRRVVQQVAWTPDGKTLVSSDTEEATVRSWDLDSGKERTILRTGRADYSGAPFAIAGDGNTLVLGGTTTIALWDLTTGRQVSVVASGGKHAYHNVATAPNGRTVAAYCDDGSVKVWARDGDSWRQQPAIHGHGWHSALAFSPDAKVLGVAGATLKCYDPATGQARLTLSGHIGHVYSVNFSANGKVLASGGQDQTARLWDAATGRQLTCLAHPVMVYGAVVSADGKVVATAVGDIRVWDAARPEEALILPHTAAVSAVAFSGDGQTLAMAGPDGTKLWHLEQRKVVATFPASAGLAFSRDGKTLATANNSGTIDVWSVSGERQAVLQGHASPVQSLAFSPDGKSLASASNEPNAILWDLSTRKPRAWIKLAGNMTTVAFSPDGKTLAAGSQFGVVKLFEAVTGRETATLRRFELAATHTKALAFSPDSTLLAGSNTEGLVQIWDVATGRLHAALKGHVGAVSSLCFAPDGRTLATAGSDHTVKLWDVAPGQERCTLKGHKGAVLGVEFAPDGNTLVTCSGDGTVRLWPAAVDSRARERKKELEADLPRNPAAHNEQGDCLWQYDRTAEAERAYNGALARLEKLAATFPDSSGLRQEMIRSLLSRTMLLEHTGRPAEAAPARERAREIYRNLSPNDQYAMLWGYRERGRKLASIGNLRQAERTYSQAHELNADWPSLWEFRGRAYSELKQWDRAIADYSKTIELNPKYAEAWTNRGLAYMNLSRWDKAVADFSKAIELDPKFAAPRINRGVAFANLGQWDKAIAEYQEAIRLKKDFAEVHCNLGYALRSKGQFAESLASLRRGHELGSRNPRWPYPSAQWVRDAERLVALEDKLPDLLSGKEQPADTAERLALAQLCQMYKKRYAAAARFYAEAFSAEPKLIGDQPSDHRYNAACAAALAGSGQGEDAKSLDDKEQARLRAQGRDWLRADLAAWRRLLEKEPATVRAALAPQMQHWLNDPDFAGVRGSEALGRLPAAERPDWQKLWRDVEELRQRAAEPAGPAKSEKKAPPK